MNTPTATPVTHCANCAEIQNRAYLQRESFLEAQQKLLAKIFRLQKWIIKNVLGETRPVFSVEDVHADECQRVLGWDSKENAWFVVQRGLKFDYMDDEEHVRPIAFWTPLPSKPQRPYGHAN